MPLLVYTEISMALQIRRGTDAQRQTTLFKSGEVIYTTDSKDLFIGDNVTLGGTQVAPVKSVNGSTGTVVLTTTQVTEGTNQYYTANRAKFDAGAALTGGNAGNSGISFTWNSGTNTITAVVTAGGYSLPVATTSALGGVKISGGGLSIDGAGLLSVATPVATGVIGQLTYYTGTNAVTATGTGLNWATTNPNYPGGLLNVAGEVNANRVDLQNDLTTGGMFISTQVNQDASTEVFAIFSAHTQATPTAARFFRSRGTIASPVTVNNTDTIFDLQFVGGTGATGAGIAAQIRASVNGTVSSSVVPGKLTLSAANASGTLIDTQVIDSTGINVTGNLKYSGLRISAANFITVATSTTYVLSTTQHKNVLLVTSGSLTATLTFPASPVDGQLLMISVHTNNVTLALTAGPTLSGTFAGAVTAPTTFEYIYRSSNTTWYRIQ